ADADARPAADAVPSADDGQRAAKTGAGEEPGTPDNGDKPAADADRADADARPAADAVPSADDGQRAAKTGAGEEPGAPDNGDKPAADADGSAPAKPASAANEATRRPAEVGDGDKPAADDGRQAGTTGADEEPSTADQPPAAAAPRTDAAAGATSGTGDGQQAGETTADGEPGTAPASAADKAAQRPAEDGAPSLPAARSAGGGDRPAADRPAGDGSRPAGKAPSGERTTVLRLPEQARDGVDQATTFLRVPTDADEAKTEREEAREEKAVDQATTFLRVPADSKPRTDQATTHLHAPGAPGAPEEETPKPADQATAHLRTPPAPDVAPKPAAKAPAPAPPRPESPPAPAAQAPAPPMPSVPPPPADAERDPLELLAALTNRPAPPPTPLRTAIRRIKIYTPLAVLLLIVLVVAQSLRPLPEPGLTLTAAESFTFDGEAPSVPWPAAGQAALEVEGLGDFGTSGEQQPVPIASVAKVMTAYVILREHPMESGSPGAAIPVDEQAEEDAGLSDDGESTVEVTAGSEISQYEALQAIMIASANNVARLLARWDAGSEEAFVDKMNETAAELGMENTTYTDPSGLNSDTVSTAEDQVLLGRAAMEDPVFREIVGSFSYDDSQGENHPNWNQLVTPGSGVVGIKTGTTTAAGGNLLFAAVQEIGGEQQTIIGAVLAQPPDAVNNSILTGALNAGRELIEFAQERLRGETVFSAGQEIGYVDDGLGGHTPLVVTEDVTAAGWDGLEVRVELAAGGDGVPGTADAGTEVGTVTVGGASVPVALGEELSEPGFTDRLLRLG
ncbi:D-alanyl-D-alanine carboxypeptidase family protein, partial [Streptomyces sp. NPDC127098]|uniref:D-alanyl-D-alanine carboxypeptidase family protein n=1 Tax=Streptomyces sp. NPDC127098 TaxID=3347137 RepID=UPI003654E805